MSHHITMQDSHMVAQHAEAGIRPFLHTWNWVVFLFFMSLKVWGFYTPLLTEERRSLIHCDGWCKNWLETSLLLTSLFCDFRFSFAWNVDAIVEKRFHLFPFAYWFRTVPKNAAYLNRTGNLWLWQKNRHWRHSLDDFRWEHNTQSRAAYLNRTGNLWLISNLGHKNRRGTLRVRLLQGNDFVGHTHSLVHWQSLTYWQPLPLTQEQARGIKG